MGLLDQLLGSALGGGAQEGLSDAHASGLAQALISMLNDPQIGGVQGLMQRFQQGGLGEVFGSWVGTGQNQPLSIDDLHRMLGQGQMGQLSQQANVPPQQAPSLMAALLPVLIDQLTPRGQMPAQGQPAPQASDLLRSFMGASGRIG